MAFKHTNWSKGCIEFHCFLFFFFFSCQFVKPSEKSPDYPDLAKEAGNLIIIIIIIKTQHI